LGCGLVVLHEIRLRGGFVARRSHVAGVTAGALAIVASFTVPGPRAVEQDAYWTVPLLGGEALGLVAFADAWRRTRRLPGRPAEPDPQGS